MSTIHIPCPVGEVSDGYHSFDELYAHRNALFLVLMKLNPESSWFSRAHADGTGISDWFIAGIRQADGRMMTYHMPLELWMSAKSTGAELLDQAPAWDGHTPTDVLERLMNLVRGPVAQTPVAPYYTQTVIDRLKEKALADLTIAETRTALLTLLDAVDYTNKACRPNEMIGAVLDVQLIKNARKVLLGGAS